MAGMTKNIGFYGVDSTNVELYIEAIKKDCGETMAAIKTDLEKILFPVLRENWQGQAEENFEYNVNKLADEVVNSIQKAEIALIHEIQAVAQSWVEQDKVMVGRVD